MPEIAKTADQALLVLSAVIDDGPVTAQEVATSLGLNRTVTHRLLTTLQLRGFVRKDGSDYTAGPFFLKAAQRAWPAAYSRARSVIRELAERYGETVLLTVADGDQAIAIDQAVAERYPVRVGYRIGERHPMSVGASGRAILAYLEPARIERITDAIEDLDELRRLRGQLAELRERGYAESRNELHPGIFGLAVPLLGEDGHALASLALLAPAERADHLRTLVPEMQRVARRLAKTLTAG